MLGLIALVVGFVTPSGPVKQAAFAVFFIATAVGFYLTVRHHLPKLLQQVRTNEDRILSHRQHPISRCCDHREDPRSPYWIATKAPIRLIPLAASPCGKSRLNGDSACQGACPWALTAPRPSRAQSTASTSNRQTSSG